MLHNKIIATVLPKVNVEGRIIDANLNTLHVFDFARTEIGGVVIILSITDKSITGIIYSGEIVYLHKNGLAVVDENYLLDDFIHFRNNLKFAYKLSLI